MSSTKITLKRNKKLDKFFNEESGLCFKGPSEKIVIGRIENGAFISLDEVALELCEKYGFTYDESLVQEEIIGGEEVDETDETNETVENQTDENQDETKSQTEDQSELKEVVKEVKIVKEVTIPVNETVKESKVKETTKEKEKEIIKDVKETGNSKKDFQAKLKDLENYFLNSLNEIDELKNKLKIETEKNQKLEKEKKDLEVKVVKLQNAVTALSS